MKLNGRSRRSRRSVSRSAKAALLAGLALAAGGLAACAGRSQIDPYPNVAQTPTPPEAVLTPDQKDAKIEALQAEAKRNAARGGL